MAVAATNRQVRLAARPHGLPTLDVWQYTEEPVAEPGDDELLVEVTHVSLDPAMRGWMDDRRSYVPPVQLGDVMRAPCAGRVIASNHPSIADNAWVTGMFGAQQYAISDGRGVRQVNPERAPLPRYLGALGLTGLTAYFGMVDVGRPRHGDTVVISGAAGAVGSTAAQIAKLNGCRTIGIAGSTEKCDWLTSELGLDAAINYKVGDLAGQLRRLTPDRIDVYFDNVGGETLDLALARLALHARVVICGAISQYNATTAWGPSNYLSLLVNRASMAGLIVFDYENRYNEATEQLLEWLDTGQLKAREEIVRGPIDRFPDTLLDLFAGKNTGKLILELAQTPPTPCPAGSTSTIAEDPTAPSATSRPPLASTS